MTLRILVTGANDGIGRETALALLRQGHHVIVHGRNADRAGKAASELGKQANAPADRVSTAAFDLSSLAQVRDGANALLAAHPALDVAVLNAGLYNNERKLSADGYELTFAVNHLAHFFLAQQLAPALERAAAETGQPSRVVAVASMAHVRGAIDFTDLQSSKSYSAYGAYALSKSCNILFAQELAARSDPKKLIANSLHPGVVGTKLLRAGFGMSGGPDSLAEGAETSVFLASSVEGGQVTGKFFVRSRESLPSAQSREPKNAKRLWELTLELLDKAPTLRNH
ncbi:MAG: SDR family NAD(P)-dependent oxidoreductase [Deltaproteobacteria bacterium]|nr:SDR family NAD(P)-dependent oxidoreductase [Deltaproteobacteria bacterium]